MMSQGRAKRLSSVKPRVSAEPVDPLRNDVMALENGRMAESLAAVSELSAHVAAENRQLQAEAAERERENFEVGEYLRRDLTERKHELADLAERKQEAERQAEVQLQELQARTAQEREEAEARAAGTEAALRQHVQELESRLASVAGFRQQQASIAREMEYLRSERDRAKQQLVDQAEAHAAALQQQREELRAEAQQAAAAATIERDNSLESRLDARSAAVLQDNKQLRAELKLHAEESAQMCTELRELRDCQQALLREVAIQRQLEAQYSQRGAAQARETAAARKETAALAAKAAAADAGFQAQLQAAAAAATADRAAAEAEADTLRRMLDLKGRELKQLKTLSQAVLQQRSDIELFLLSSLEMVQAHVAKRSPAQREPGAADTALLPSTADAPLSVPHFDLPALTWEDREKVLRLLFARLNDPKQQAFFEKLPAHIM